MTTKTATRRGVKLSYLIQSRAVFDKDGTGHRFSGGKIRWGKWRTWNRRLDNELNLREAIRWAMLRLKTFRLGAVVYIRAVVNNRASKEETPIFEAKWGHDDLPYMAWKDNPAAYYWKRRLSVR